MQIRASEISDIIKQEIRQFGRHGSARNRTGAAHRRRHSANLTASIVAAPESCLSSKAAYTGWR